MNTDIEKLNSADDIQTTPSLSDINQLVVEAYESSPEKQKDQMVAQLVGEIYQQAPLPERGRIIEHLLQPVGLLALITVANGIFAKILLHDDWSTMRVQLEDVERVKASDVIALADYVQQVSAQAVNNLVHLLAHQPLLAGSTAAAVLVTVLMKRANFRRADDFSGADDPLSKS